MKRLAGRMSTLSDLRGAAAAGAAAILLAAAPAAQAGWTQLTSGTSNALWDVSFPVDSMTGYAVGQNGVILKTTNGGTTWTNVQDPAYTNTLIAVHFPMDASMGYAVGNSGRILKTTDGGASWTPLTSPFSINYRDVRFLDNGTGYVVGQVGAIIKTTDGGSNWTDISDPAFTGNMDGVCFPVDATTGYVSGYQAILKTVNGGTSWTDVSTTCGACPPATEYWAVDFPVNATTGHVTGQPGPAQVYTTSDGGLNWTIHNGDGTVHWGMDFADASTGYVAAGADGILKTSDGGATWTTHFIGGTQGLYNVCAVDALTAYAVGSSGIIYKTSDGGGDYVAMHPTATGTTNTFSSTTGCAAGSQWDCVNDQSGNAGTGFPAAVDAATYVRDNNNQTHREMYGLANGLIPAGSVVNGIEVRAWVGKTGTNPTAALSYRRVGIDAGYINGPTETIPWNGCCGIEIIATWSCLNWTPAHIDALEIGIVHQSDGAVLVGQIHVLVNYTAPGGPTAGTNYRSIGPQAGNLYSTGNATVTACAGTVVTFGGGASLPTNIGLGDKLVIGAGTYYILSRDSATQVTLQAATGTVHTAAAYAIQRSYTTLQAWEDDRDGNLVGEGRSEVGVCYNDGAFTSPLVISGSTTDAAHFMKLTVAEGQRHGGLRNTGAVIDAQGGFGGVHAITVEDEYTQIEWLEIKGIQDTGDGIHFSSAPPADDSLASNIFVHSCWQNANAAFRVHAQDVTVRNCLATGGTSYAVAVMAGGSVAIESCTFVGSTLSGVGVQDGVGTTTSVKNTISVNHWQDRDFVLSSSISYFGNNMYRNAVGFDPATYQGGNKSPPTDLEQLLASLATEDFHLEASGHSAGGNGLDLSASFTNDIDGQVRRSPWDIGADDDLTTSPTSSTPRIIVWREVPPS